MTTNKKHLSAFLFLIALIGLSQMSAAQTIVKKGAKYDTIIRKHVTKAKVKPKPKKVIIVKPIDTVKAVIIPTPEFVNQPYYYDTINHKLIRLENASAQMITKKKTFGLKGAKQTLTMDDISSKIRFTSKKDIVFMIKTSGDVIDLTSYIRLYRFVPNDEKREVTINSKEGLLADKDESKGELISFSVKSISPDKYLIQLSHQLDAGEYGFVWVKNMELKEFTVFAFGIDWKSSN